MKRVVLYTDGACSGNPGPGGWGCLLSYQNVSKELSGGAKETTNNRMEITAVIEGLKLLKQPCLVDLYTDSKYVLEGATKWLYTDSKYVLEGATKWLEGWIQKNWRRADKKPVSNVDLWQELVPLLHRHQIVWHWVKGHAGEAGNERVDMLACLARDEAARA